jgi:two-component system OmpR family response regulator
MFIIFQDMDDNQISQKQEPSAASAQGQSNPVHRILLVDDDRDIRSLNADVLKSSGYVVDTAENGASGWLALQSKHYDLLITDNTMPGVTGLELIKQLRSEDMTLSVILASGTVPAEELNRCPWLQVDALLPKPYTVSELLRTVNDVLRMADNSR